MELASQGSCSNPAQVRGDALGVFHDENSGALRQLLAMDKAITSTIPRGADVFVSTSTGISALLLQECSIPGCPSRNLSATVWQLQHISLDIQPAGTTPGHLHCLPALSFWIPSAVLGSPSLSPQEVSLWGLLSFPPLEKGALSCAFLPEELPTGSRVSMGMSLRTCVCCHLYVSLQTIHPVHPCALDHEPKPGRRALTAVLGSTLASHRQLPSVSAPSIVRLQHFATSLLEPPPSCSAQLSWDNVSHRTGPPLSGGRRRVERDAFCPLCCGVSRPTVLCVEQLWGWGHSGVSGDHSYPCTSLCLPFERFSSWLL